MSATTLVGAALGYGIGYAVATNPERPLTGGNGYIFDAVSKFALVAPFTIPLVSVLQQDTTSPERWRSAFTAGIIGQVAGYGLSALLLNGHDFTYRQEVTIRGFAGAGALLPSLSALLIGSITRSPEPYIAAPLLGSIGWGIGFLISLMNELPEARSNFLRTTARRKVLVSSSSMSSADINSPSWLERFVERTQVEISPLGLLGILSPNAAFMGLGTPILQIRHAIE